MRRALLVGIDDYPSPLSGCVEDARALERLLRRHDDGSRNFDTQLLVSDEADVTRSRLRQAIDALFADPAEVALLFFSGHGTENDLGGYLVTSDATAYDEGVALADVLGQANRARHVREVVLILDSCHSGWLGTPPEADNSRASIREGVSILTASRASQRAVERDGGGVFSELLRAALEGGAADILGRVSVASVYAYIDQALGAWDQRPLLKAHVSHALSLRQARPAIDVGILRTLPEIFDAADAELPLTLRHEPSAEPRDPDAERVFRGLQRCNRVKLVEPSGAEDMYYAAVNNAACRLTALGRFYWRLARDERL